MWPNVFVRNINGIELTLLGRAVRPHFEESASGSNRSEESPRTSQTPVQRASRRDGHHH